MAAEQMKQTGEKSGVKRILLRAFFVLCCVMLLVAFDQWTKQLAVQHLQNQAAIALIPGVLELVFVKNFGAAFGILQGGQIFFFLIAGTVSIVLFVLLLRLPARKRFLPLAACFVFIIAGALGNLADRVLHTYVVDFIYFVPIDFPVFNVADIYITCSCAVLVLLLLFFYKDDEFSFKKEAGR